MTEFNLNKKREELVVYLRQQGFSINICQDILRVVMIQDKEFTEKLKEELLSERFFYENITKLKKHKKARKNICRIIDEIAGNDVPHAEGGK